jgi:two-component system sensor histidine kinase TctE
VNPAQDKAPAQPTLLRDLLLRLLVPLLAIVAATGAMGVLTAQHLTDRTFDRWLLDGARSLARQVQFDDGRARVDLGGDAEAILAFDVVDRTYYAVEQGDRHVIGQAGLPGHGDDVTRYSDGELFNASFAGHTVRVAAVTVDGASPPARVLVAETLLKRRAVRDDLALMALPLAALMMAAAVAIILASRWTLRPLQTLAARWQAQSHASLQPVSLTDVPRELTPFATALNGLLGRIHDMLARERRFAANAAHQIRTPLTGLQLGLSRAAEAPDLASARGVIAELQATTLRTARLLQQLLALGRLDPETAHDLTPEPVDLGRLAEEVGAIYLETALERGIELELNAPAQPVRALVHADLVSEALGNLVDNALRYTPSGGTVLIDVEATPPALVVEDSGPGIVASQRAAVLERFVRGAGAPGDGSGLGLAIVHEIAQLHHTELVLDDSPLGGLAARIEFKTTG